MRTPPTTQLSVSETTETLPDVVVIPCHRVSSEIPKARSESRDDALMSGKFVNGSRGASLNGAIIRPDVQEAVTYSFRTRQALPLVFTRLLCPRSGRDGSSKRSRNSRCTWPRTRQIRDLDLSAVGISPRPIRVHEQVLSALSPRSAKRSRMRCTHERNASSKVLKRTVATHTDCPRTVHDLGLSTFSNSPRTKLFQEPQLAKNCPGRRIVVTMSSTKVYRVNIRIISSYVLI